MLRDDRVRSKVLFGLMIIIYGFTYETVLLRMRLDPTVARLKLSQNPQYLVSGPNEAQVFDVSFQREFSERQNDRLEVGLFREKHTPQIECGPSQRASMVALKCGVVSFNGLGNFIS